MNRNELPEMIASMEPLNAGFCITDPNDARHQYITYLRRSYGQFLHKASVSLRQQGEENTVDAVQMLVSSSSAHFNMTDNNVSLKIRAVRTYMLEYGDSRDR
jgi:proteasome activator subunit 4